MKVKTTLEKITEAASDLGKGAMPVPDDAPEAAKHEARLENFRNRLHHISPLSQASGRIVDGKIVIRVIVPRVFDVSEDGDAVEVSV